MLHKIITISLVFFLAHLSLFAEEPKEETIDHMALATMMFYDGKDDKAIHELTLAKKAKESIDWSKYYSIEGMIHLRKEAYPQAIASLKKAIETTRTKVYEAPKADEPERKYLFSVASDKKIIEPKITVPAFDAEKIKKEKVEELYIYLSQAYYRNKQYQETIMALDNAGSKGRDRAALFTLRAECYWNLKQYAGALDTLSRGFKLFPKDSTLLKQKFYYFAELKLYQAAIEAAKVYMTHVPANVDEHIALSQMLVSGGEENEAIKVLEEAKITFPRSAKINMLLGYLYNKKDMPHTTAHLFEQGSYIDRKYLKEAAEMYRRSGNLSHALYLNAQMENQAEKAKQQVAIYIDRGEFEKVIGLKDALDRYGLLDDDALRYALAYAYYVVKDYDEAEEHLKKIVDNELFSKATIIRKNIEKCKNNSLECI